MTGFSEEALFEKASQARPIGFLRKPFSEAELIVCLESVLERDRAGEGLETRLPGIRSISENLTDAVVVSDLSGNVRYLNTAAEKLTGCRAMTPVRNLSAESSPSENRNQASLLRPILTSQCLAV